MLVKGSRPAVMNISASFFLLLPGGEEQTDSTPPLQAEGPAQHGTQAHSQPSQTPIRVTAFLFITFKVKPTQVSGSSETKPMQS